MGQSNEQPDSHSLWSGPDPHGQAALLLIESLLHALIEKSVLTAREALTVVEGAAEAKAEIASDIGEAPAELEKALALLGAIAASLHHDIKD